MPAGRPRKFTKVEDMEKLIQKYFADCDKKKEPYTVTGLALACGFNSRTSFLDYCERRDEDDKEFVNTIKNAKAKVEYSLEQGLISGKYNATGAIFNLKNNYGWKDKTEVENSGEQTLNVNIKVMEHGS